jgi:hypothetical protein
VTPDASSALLNRLQRGAILWCVAAIAVTLVLAPSRTDVLFGIAGGGLLAIVSFYAIRSSMDVVMRPPPVAAGPEPASPDGDAPARPGRAGAVLKLAGRYALLALLAYVMIGRLRLHPLGLLVGVTALVASATAEAIRGLGRPGRAS